MSQREDYAKAIEAMQKAYGFDAARTAIESTLFKMGKEGGASRLDLEQLVLPKTRKLIKSVVDDYDKVVTLANDVYSDLGYDVNRDLLTIKDLENSQLREWGKFEDKTLDNLEYELRMARLNNEGSKAIEARLRGPLGKMEYVAPTLARHFVKTHGQACKNRKADSAGVFYYSFVGPTPRDIKGPSRSHVFCLMLYKNRNRTFHKDDIERMKNGQREPVMLNRGGYRCRHDWEPDPFFKDRGRSVVFITVPDGKRDVVIGKWEGSSSTQETAVDKKKWKKIDIGEASKLLEAKGYKLGAGKFDLENQVTVYEVQQPDGTTKKLTTDEIRALV